MLMLCAGVTLVGIIVAITALSQEAPVPTWAAASVAGLLLPPLAWAVGIRWLFWRQVANGVEVTVNQLTQLHGIHTELSSRLGLEAPPRLIVVNGNGTLNAHTAKCRLRHGYVVLFSDLVELAYEQNDWNGLAFMLAHELGHIRCGHVALWRRAITVLPKLVGLDRSLTRAQEYTADRCASLIAPAGTRAMFALYAGKRLHRLVDPGVHLQSIADDGGLWVCLVNLASSHPVGHRRLAALSRVDAEGWDVHGRMC